MLTLVILIVVIIIQISNAEGIETMSRWAK